MFAVERQGQNFGSKVAMGKLQLLQYSRLEQACLPSDLDKGTNRLVPRMTLRGRGE
jgi:hypothetical protein